MFEKYKRSHNLLECFSDIQKTFLHEGITGDEPLLFKLDSVSLWIKATRDSVALPADTQITGNMLDCLN